MVMKSHTRLRIGVVRLWMEGGPGPISLFLGREKKGVDAFRFPNWYAF